MNSHGLTRENLVATLPIALQKDPSAVALAEAMAELLAQRLEEIEQLRIYPVIDRLNEQLLDILAYDFKVDWWDPEYSIEEKCRTLKDSWHVHKLLGTKAAVETAISAIYPNTRVEEWFEYGGNPYGFRLHLDITGTVFDEARPRRILERVEYYKSLRSHLDALQYTLRIPPASLRIGGGAGLRAQVGVPAGRDAWRFRQILRAGGTAGLQVHGGMTGRDAPPARTTVLRMGGVYTVVAKKGD